MFIVRAMPSSRGCHRRTARCRPYATTSPPAQCDFPALTIVVNGGLGDWDAIERELSAVDGIMLGRLAYHDPYALAAADWRVFGDDAPVRSRAEVVRELVPYAARQLARGVLLRGIARHVLGLYHGRSGARRFRQILSDAARLRDADPSLFLEALAAVEPVEALPA